MDRIQSTKAQGRVADAPSGHWVYRLLPREMWPYAQLARWDRPIGWQLLMWPCFWSLTLAATATAERYAGDYSWQRIVWHLILFFIGAVAMRGAGCTWNDFLDRDIDEKVERTRSRPLPSGQVTGKQALGFLVLQSLVGLAVLLSFNWFTVILGAASLGIVAVYPLMKRFTNWPQLILGFAFSWGALVGWASLRGQIEAPALLLYAGSVLWAIGYDTIYAHQDKEDDALVGVRSTARLFGDKTKYWMMGLYGAALMLFTASLAVAIAPMPALAGLLAAASHMARQIRTLDIDDPDQCLKLFKSNGVVGLLIFLGLAFGGLWTVFKPLI